MVTASASTVSCCRAQLEGARGPVRTARWAGALVAPEWSCGLRRFFVDLDLQLAGAMWKRNVLVSVVAVIGGGCTERVSEGNPSKATPPAVVKAASPAADSASANAARMVAEGRQTFRYDTFADEAFWGAALGLHKAIEGQAHGGVGAGVSPKAALSVGLKVDAEALPAELVAQIKAGKVDLDSVETTLALLKLDAVVGVKGFFDGNGRMTSMGVTCAFCHSTVDDSFAPGIG